MHLTTLVIIGHGKLAEAVSQYAITHKIEVMPFEQRVDNPSTTVALHAGSGRQLDEAVELCSRYQIPLIQASTGLTIKREIDFPLVNAPNLALPIIAFFKGLTAFAEAFSGFKEHYRMELTESHQSSKKSVPGTALKFAQALNLDSKQIRSIREEEEQRRLGIPDEHLGRHGYHHIVIHGVGIALEMKTAVHGLQAYAEGALWTAIKLVERRLSLQNKVYEIEELITNEN